MQIFYVTNILGIKQKESHLFMISILDINERVKSIKNKLQYLNKN